LFFLNFVNRSLSGNPWDCSCIQHNYLAWISEQLKSEKLTVTDVQESLCITPTHAFGIKLISVESSSYFMQKCSKLFLLVKFRITMWNEENNLASLYSKHTSNRFFVNFKFHCPNFVYLHFRHIRNELCNSFRIFLQNRIFFAH